MFSLYYNNYRSCCSYPTLRKEKKRIHRSLFSSSSNKAAPYWGCRSRFGVANGRAQLGRRCDVPAPQPVIALFLHISHFRHVLVICCGFGHQKLDLFAKKSKRILVCDGCFLARGTMTSISMCSWKGQAMLSSSSPDSTGALIPCSASPLPMRRPRSTHPLLDDDDMGFDDSSSDGSPTPSPSPNSRYRFPSLAFVGAIDIPFKSPVSKPSTTSTTSPYSNLSLSPITPPSSLSGPAFASCAYPSWPQRDNLSLNSPSYCGAQANSHISDDDLLDLAELELIDGMRIAPGMRTEISWEQTRQPPLVLHSLPSVAKKAQPIPKKRRRSTPLKRKKMVLGMSPIAEAPE